MKERMYRLWKSMLSLRNRVLEAKRITQLSDAATCGIECSDPFGILWGCFLITRCIVVNSFAPVAPFSSDLQAEILHNTDVLDLPDQCPRFLGTLTTFKEEQMETLGSTCSISSSHSFLLFIVFCLLCLYTLYSSSIISFPILLFAKIVRHLPCVCCSACQVFASLFICHDFNLNVDWIPNCKKQIPFKTKL